jgi:N-acetylglucosamine kinase-like BadF-type ATPase
MRFALGIDAGGTQTRWALLDAAGEIAAEGEVRGFSALQARGADKRTVVAILGELARAVLAVGSPDACTPGLPGSAAKAKPCAHPSPPRSDLDPSAVTVGSDIETTYLDLFAPGKGYVVYAGTGSVAAFVDEAGRFIASGAAA